MKDRPILFSAPMVRALLNGSKKQTRRVIKPEPQMVTDKTIAPWAGDPSVLMRLLEQSGKCCPYGQPSDQLWVRETFAEGIHQLCDSDHWVYAADPFGHQHRLGDKWKPSIFMPRAASRITLEIVSVRVERLQDISEFDAAAEGLLYSTEHIGHWSGTGEQWFMTARDAYRNLWESINGPGSWDLNPWAWVVEFKKVAP